MSILRNLNRPRSGYRVLGTRRVGVLGSLCPEIGAHGPSAAWRNPSTPPSASAFVRFEVTVMPEEGELKMYEDTSFEFTSSVEGRFWFKGVLYYGNVSQGEVTHTLTIGDVPALCLRSDGRLEYKLSITKNDRLLQRQSNGAMRASADSVPRVVLNNGAWVTE